MFVVAGGGGARALHAYLGVARALDDHDAEWRNHIRGLAGVSAGALWALMLAMGTPEREQRRLLDGLEWRADLSRMISDYAVTDGSQIRNAVLTILKLGGLHVDSTLGDFERLLRVRFVCVATDVTTNKAVQLEARAFPEMRVADAVYASCAMPLLSPPLYYKDSVFVDGNTLLSLPLCFQDEQNVFCVDLLNYEEQPCAVTSATEYTRALMRVLMNRDSPRPCLHLPTKRLAPDPMIVSEADAMDLYTVGYAFTLDMLMNGLLMRWICKTTVLVAQLIAINERYPPTDDAPLCEE